MQQERMNVWWEVIAYVEGFNYPLSIYATDDTTAKESKELEFYKRAQRASVPL